MTQTKENIASEIVSIESLELGITDFRQKGVDTSNADTKKEPKMVNNGTSQTLSKILLIVAVLMNQKELLVKPKERLLNFWKERERMLKPWWKKPMEVEIPMLR